MKKTISTFILITVFSLSSFGAGMMVDPNGLASGSEPDPNGLKPSAQTGSNSHKGGGGDIDPNGITVSIKPMGFTTKGSYLDFLGKYYKILIN